MRFRIPPLRSPHRRFLLGLGLGVLASAAVALVTSLGYFSGYQGTALDLFFWAQGRARAPEIVLVGIDDAAFQRLNERQPLPRDYLAGLIRGLRKSGARAIGMDVPSAACIAHLTETMACHNELLGGRGRRFLIVEDMDLEKDLGGLVEVRLWPWLVHDMDSGPCAAVGIID